MDGILEVYVGAMSSGKTKKLVEMFNQLTHDGVKVKVFKPMKDTRNDDGVVVARNGLVAPATSVDSIDDIYSNGGEMAQVVLIDEIQFFNDEDTMDSLIALCLMGIDVYCFGLDLTSEGQVFGRMGEILAHADKIHKLYCDCVRCKAPARMTYFKGENKTGEVQVGDLDVYEPLCRSCYFIKEWEESIHSEIADDDPLYHFQISGTDSEFFMELLIPKSKLEGSGYTFGDVKEIDNIVGAKNLLDDLGITPERFIEGGGFYE